MNTVALDIGGCAVEFRCSDAGTAVSLSADFAAFPGRTGNADVSIEARLERAVPPSFAIPGPGGWSIVPSLPGTRRVWYREGARCEYDYASRRGRITAADPGLLWELSYLLILSRAGEELDRRGLHRLHAAGLARGGRAFLLCGGQGTGKTTLFMELLKDRSFSLLSDDTPLVSGNGRVIPFPQRIGLDAASPHLPSFSAARRFSRRRRGEKFLVDIDKAGIPVSPPAEPGAVFLLRRSGGPPRIRPAGRTAAARELFLSLVLGSGTPQLAEYYLRFSPAGIAAKARIMASRLRAAAALRSGAGFYILETSPDPARNAATVRSFLDSGSAWAPAASRPSRPTVQ